LLYLYISDTHGSKIQEFIMILLTMQGVEKSKRQVTRKHFNKTQ